MNFGPMIKILRVTAGMTQEDLADVSGVSQGYISKLERGQFTDIGVTDLHAMVKAISAKLDGWKDFPLPETVFVNRGSAGITITSKGTNYLCGPGDAIDLEMFNLEPRNKK